MTKEKEFNIIAGYIEDKLLDVNAMLEESIQLDDGYNYMNDRLESGELACGDDDYMGECMELNRAKNDILVKLGGIALDPNVRHKLANEIANVINKYMEVSCPE